MAAATAPGLNHVLRLLNIGDSEVNVAPDERLMARDRVKHSGHVFAARRVRVDSDDAGLGVCCLEEVKERKSGALYTTSPKT